MKKRGPLDFSRTVTITFIISFFIIFALFFIIFGVDKVKVEGVIKPLTFQVVTPKIQGNISKIHYKDGDLIKKGDLLVEIDDREFKQELVNREIERQRVALEAERQKAQLELLESKSELLSQKREQDLFYLNFQYEQKSISKKQYNERLMATKLEKLNSEHELSNAGYALQSSLLRLKELDLEIEGLKEKLENCRIYSQLDGVVMEENDELKEGRTLSPGEQIQVVYSSEKVFAELSIEESEISKVEPGQQVKIYVTGLPHRKYKVFEGRVQRLQRVKKDKVQYYKGIVEIDDPYFTIKSNNVSQTRRLLYGMTLRAEIIVGKKSLIKKFLKIDEE